MDAINKCEQIIKDAIANNFLQQISNRDLETQIMKTLRIADQRTITKYKAALLRLGYIEPLMMSHIYRWNMEKLCEMRVQIQTTIQQGESQE